MKNNLGEPYYYINLSNLSIIKVLLFEHIGGGTCLQIIRYRTLTSIFEKHKTIFMTQEMSKWMKDTENSNIIPYSFSAAFCHTKKDCFKFARNYTRYFFCSNGKLLYKNNYYCKLFYQHFLEKLKKI